MLSWSKRIEILLEILLTYIFICQVTEAKGFGLLGEYFNNRWTFGDPVLTRVDAKVDFSWSETETITPTGQDYISVRCIVVTTTTIDC